MTVLGQDPKVNLSVRKNILPEDRWEVRDSLLGFQTLEGPLNVDGVDVSQEVSFVDN